MKAKQIVVLEIEVDTGRVPLPEVWEWDQIGPQLNGGAAVRLLASGQPVFTREPAVPEEPVRYGGTE